MTDEQLFFEAVRETPEDDDLRMVVADWYESHGDPRAEFIRVQLALHRLPLRHPWRAEMKAREAELLRAHGRRWNVPAYRLLNDGPLKNKFHSRRAPVRGWKYRRGFIEVVRAEAATFLRHGRLLFQLGPLQVARLYRAARSLYSLLTSPHLKRLTGLDLSHNNIGSSGASMLAASPHVAHLTELNLTANGLGDDAAEALVNSPCLGNLKRLVLSQNRFSFEAIMRLNSHFGDAAQQENGDILGRRMWSRLAGGNGDRGPREVSYDDKIYYEDGRMYEDGRHRAAADNPRDWADQWNEEADFDVYDEEEYGKEQEEDEWGDMRREPDDDEEW